jgi:hypothetical protein
VTAGGQVTIIPIGVLKRVSVSNPVSAKVPGESGNAIGSRSIGELKPEYPPFFIAALTAGQVEAPLFAVGQHAHRDAFVECILEELAVPIQRSADALHLNEDAWATRVSEQREVDPLSGLSILWKNLLRIRFVPPQSA